MPRDEHVDLSDISNPTVLVSPRRDPGAAEGEVGEHRGEVAQDVGAGADVENRVEVDHRPIRRLPALTAVEVNHLTADEVSPTFDSALYQVKSAIELATNLRRRYPMEETEGSRQPTPHASRS